MAPTIKSLVSRFRTAVLSPSDKTPEAALFPKTDPAVDGEECLHDCETCTVHLPAKFKIDEEDQLYGFVKGWSTHLVVATGKTDWVRDVADEPDSVMEAVGKSAVQPTNGRLMLSASNMPLPPQPAVDPAHRPTTVLLLPAFTFLDNVTPRSVPDLITQHINPAPTNTTPLPPASLSPPPTTTTTPAPPSPSLTGLVSRPCPHNYLILLCSQKTRDARCGQSAPLLKREFERHLRPLSLYRDLTDDRPGGVGIYFISHVGGHKYSANVMVYRRAGMPGAGADEPAHAGDGHANGSANGSGQTARMPAGEAAQCIWLARVRPEDCENIVRYTVLQGKVVKPERQLRGGFDRAKGLVSW